VVCRGVHFAVTGDRFAEFLAAGSDEALMSLVEVIEGNWDKDWLAESDKAWDAIHRCLTDGKLEYGETPAHACVLGPLSLHEGDGYLVCPCPAADVKAVARDRRRGCSGRPQG